MCSTSHHYRASATRQKIYCQVADFRHGIYVDQQQSSPPIFRQICREAPRLLCINFGDDSASANTATKKAPGGISANCDRQAPCTIRLTKTGIPFKFDRPRREAFKELKARLTSSAILRHDDPTYEWRSSRHLFTVTPGWQIAPCSILLKDNGPRGVQL